jgi:hypothetical protein
MGKNKFELYFYAIIQAQLFSTQNTFNFSTYFLQNSNIIMAGDLTEPL